MEFNNTKVGILENGDFDASGALFTTQPVIILVYGSHCPYCKQEIPGFIQASRTETRALYAAIPTEGPYADLALLSRLNQIVPGVRGVPTFALFRGGRYVSSAANPRSGWKELINQL